jgi:hypothetical protein
MARHWTVAVGIIGLWLAALPGEAAAQRVAWWGGEVQALQTPGKGNGFGYGIYEGVMSASTGQGSITGFFNLCYADADYSNCVFYNDDDGHHFEADFEFTPVGNETQGRRWFDICTNDNNCDVRRPPSFPRVNGNTKGASINTYPIDNQLYAELDFDPYAQFHRYTITVLPSKIIWSIDGRDVMVRARNADIGVRRLSPNYARFDQLLREGQIKLILNVWDGSTGGAGFFGGPGSTNRTSGKAALIRRVTYWPADCVNNDCTVPDRPSFNSDFGSGVFIRNGQRVTMPGDQACAIRDNNSALWQKIRRSDYPVYVSPAHVTCVPDQMRISFTRNEDGS